MQSVTLSVEQQNLFDYIEQSENNIFITGRAGTGKSTLLSYLVENTKKNVAVCAPTGVAALNVGGVTIHSLFGFPFGILAEQDLARHMNKRTREVLAALDVLIIDEVSMVNADLMDAISRAMGIARGRRKLPFGGAQVVMFGDPYQLSPVPGNNEERNYMSENYQSIWFFDAKVWREDSLERFDNTMASSLQFDFLSLALQFIGSFCALLPSDGYPDQYPSSHNRIIGCDDLTCFS